MTNGNDNPTLKSDGFVDYIAINQLRGLVENATYAMDRWSRQSRSGSGDPDPRRDVDDECGFPKTLAVEHFRDMFDRNPVANRVVRLLPTECWESPPEIIEDEDPNVDTPFELSWKSLQKSLRGQSWYGGDEGNPVWEALRRADERSRVGSFGVLLLGFDDGLDLSQPVEGVTENGSRPVKAEEKTHRFVPPEDARKNCRPYTLNVASAEAPTRRLLYLRAFDEYCVSVASYEANPASPRYGHPVTYNIRFDDADYISGSSIGVTMTSQVVHWTRVIHIADNRSSSELFGVPAMKPVYNNLYSLRKLADGGPEAYWQACLGILSFETHPQLGGDVDVNLSDLRSMVEKIRNGLQRFIATSGMSAKAVSPDVKDPVAQIGAQIELICIYLAIPVRIFKGSERGELASSQDARAWNGRKQHRQNGHITPNIIIPFIDRLIIVGVLAPPGENGYKVSWPDLETLTDQERADLAVKYTESLVKYIQGGGNQLVPEMLFLTLFLGLSEEDAQMILEKAMEQLREEGIESDEDEDTEGIYELSENSYQDEYGTSNLLPVSENQAGKSLNKPFRTPDGPKKFAVYVKDEEGDVRIVRFGDPDMEIKRDDPERRKNFRARHGCDDPGPKWKPKYWSCRFWSVESVESLLSNTEER